MITLARKMLNYGFKTDIGTVRKINQDSVVAVEAKDCEGGLFVVADGMSRRKGGHVASNLTAEAMPGAVQRLLDGRPSSSDADTMVEALYQGMAAANAAVWQRGHEQTELRGMGTTCAAVLVRDNWAAYANVGDSRVYLYRAGELVQMTHDHVLLYDAMYHEFLDSGEIPQTRFRHAITRGIGFAPTVKPDLGVIGLEEGDTVLVCSDGLSNAVSSAEIARQLVSDPDPYQVCERLIASAKRNGGEDNITVIVLHYGEATLKMEPKALYDEDELEDEDEVIPIAKRAVPHPASPVSRLWLLALVLFVLGIGAGYVVRGILHARSASQIKTK